MSPVEPAITPLPNPSPRLCVTATALPSPSMTSKWVVDSGTLCVLRREPGGMALASIQPRVEPLPFAESDLPLRRSARCRAAMYSG